MSTQAALLNIEPHFVKNFWPGRNGYLPIAIVEHMMQGTMEETFRYFNGEEGNYFVSAHYGVGQDGRVWQFVRTEDTAWANGVLKEPDLSIDWLKEVYEEEINANLVTIAIEYEGYSGEPLTAAQYEAAVKLHRELAEQWEIAADQAHIVGHHRLDSIYRKANPGPAFPFTRLLEELQYPGGTNESDILYKGQIEEGEDSFEGFGAIEPVSFAVSPAALNEQEKNAEVPMPHLEQVRPLPEIAEAQSITQPQLEEVRFLPEDSEVVDFVAPNFEQELPQSEQLDFITKAEEQTGENNSEFAIDEVGLSDFEPEVMASIAEPEAGPRQAASKVVANSGSETLLESSTQEQPPTMEEIIGVPELEANEGTGSTSTEKSGIIQSAKSSEKSPSEDEISEEELEFLNELEAEPAAIHNMMGQLYPVNPLESTPVELDAEASEKKGSSSGVTSETDGGPQQDLSPFEPDSNEIITVMQQEAYESGGIPGAVLADRFMEPRPSAEQSQANALKTPAETKKGDAFSQLQAELIDDFDFPILEMGQSEFEPVSPPKTNASFSEVESTPLEVESIPLNDDNAFLDDLFSQGEMEMQEPVSSNKSLIEPVSRNEQNLISNFDLAEDNSSGFEFEGSPPSVKAKDELPFEEMGENDPAFLQGTEKASSGEREAAFQSSPPDNKSAEADLFSQIQAEMPNDYPAAEQPEIATENYPEPEVKENQVETAPAKLMLNGKTSADNMVSLPEEASEKGKDPLTELDALVFDEEIPPGINPSRLKDLDEASQMDLDLPSFSEFDSLLDETGSLKFHSSPQKSSEDLASPQTAATLQQGLELEKKQSETTSSSRYEVIKSDIGRGVISVELANLRRYPSFEQSTVTNTAAKGSRFFFDGYQEGPELEGSTRWYHFKKGSSEGWLHSKLVKLDKPFRPK